MTGEQPALAWPLKQANLLLSAISNKALYRRQSRKAETKPDAREETAARSLGSWVYNQPGLDNEIIGRADPNRAVRITGRTHDGVWRRIAFGEAREGWVFATSLDFVTARHLYAGLDSAPVPLDRPSSKAATRKSETATPAGSHFNLR